MDFARRTIRSFERTVFNRKNIESPVHSILYPDESVFAKPSDTDDDISEQVAPIVIPLENIKIGEGTFRATPLPQLCFFPSESRSACFRLQIRPNGPVFDLKPSASADTRAIFYTSFENTPLFLEAYLAAPGFERELADAMNVPAGYGWVRFSFSKILMHTEIQQRLILVEGMLKKQFGSLQVCRYASVAYKTDSWRALDISSSPLTSQVLLDDSDSSHFVVSTNTPFDSANSSSNVPFESSNLISSTSTLIESSPSQQEFEQSLLKAKELKQLMTPARKKTPCEDLASVADIYQRRSARLASKSSPISSPYTSALYADNPRAKALFVYPEGATDGILVTENELARLAPGIYLNDSLVDFDMRCTREKLASLANSPSVHFFNSFFYAKLSSANHEAVRKWTLGTGIFAHDYLVVPICESLHWFLAVIVHPWAIIPQAEQNDCHIVDRCLVLIYDSLGVSRTQVVSRLTQYLLSEAKDKLGHEASEGSIRGLHIRGPLQPNLYDCGLFMLTAIETFLSDPERVLTRTANTESSIPLPTWFDAESACKRRRDMLEFIRRLSNEHLMKGTLLPSQPTTLDDSASSDDLEILSFPPTPVLLD